MNKKLLFVASLRTKKKHYDGETNKSSDILNILKAQGGYNIDVINYSKNRFLQTFKMIFFVMFKKYYSVFIPKCIVGGSLAAKLILLFGNKHNKKVISIYIYGNAYLGFEDKKIYFDSLRKVKNIIVESDYARELMLKKQCSNDISVFPCVKPLYDIDVKPKTYKKGDVLKLIFFSRITPVKWPDKLIQAVIELNLKYQKTIFELDLAGGIPPESRDFAKNIEALCSQYDFLHYFGDSFMITGIDSYLRLQQYDLHIIPTVFIQECVPGSIIDMFIAGVPTLSSTFATVKSIINETNSFFFKLGDYQDLVDELERIYLNPSSLEQKRSLSHKEYSKYQPCSLISFLREIGVLYD